MYDLHEFLNPVTIHNLNDDNGYTDGQLAKHIAVYENELPDITDADIVLVGVNETRGKIKSHEFRAVSRRRTREPGVKGAPLRPSDTRINGGVNESGDLTSHKFRAIGRRCTPLPEPN